MKTIFCDVDGTVLDLMTQWLFLYNNDFKDSLSPSDIKQWDTHLFVKPECGEKIYDYIENPKIYFNAKQIKGSLNGINKLKKNGYKVVFVTAATLGTVGIKFNWLRNNGFINSIKEYAEIKDKSILSSNGILIDGFHNIETFEGKGILFDQYWNKHLEYKYRAKNWSEVNNLVLLLS